jgi:hypothetical protein
MHSRVLSPPPFSARLFLTIDIFANMVPIGLVFSIYDSTAEVAIQKMIDASQRMITISSSSNEGVEGGGRNEFCYEETFRVADKDS